MSTVLHFCQCLCVTRGVLQTNCRLHIRERHSSKDMVSHIVSHFVSRKGGGAGQGCIRTAVHRRRRGGYPPLLPFQCLRLTAKKEGAKRI